MKVNRLIFLLLVTVVAGIARGRPFNIIIVTSNETSEDGYREFLQDIYRGNVEVHIQEDRYKEHLSAGKKVELEAADLIIISRDNSGTDYNADADFWGPVNVPMLNHCINVVRSDAHKFWDWLPGDKSDTNPCTDFIVADANDAIFAGVDTSAGFVRILSTGKDVDHSDQDSAGSGQVVATSGGKVVIARWQGDESLYHDNSDYGPGGAGRVYFATPDKTYNFFNFGSEDAKIMLRNAIVSLLPVPRPEGDVDNDWDVDNEDLAVVSNWWQEPNCVSVDNCAGADVDGSGEVGLGDISIMAENWLAGVDVTAPEPNVMTWETEPMTISTESVYMAAAEASDAENGVEYYFDCVSGAGPDSGWQYSRVFDPNGLVLGGRYVYRAIARDTSSRLNESGWSSSAAVNTFGMYREAADASAAVAIDPNLFIMADDENNQLRIYNRYIAGSGPVADSNVSDFLNIDWAHPEGDIEGATWLGGRIFWITSHGRNRYGGYWSSRYNFFATSISRDDGQITVTVDGNYTGLIDDLIGYDSVYNLGLADAIGVADGHIDENEIAELAPKVRGLNIEGLCATADANSLLIGFRNPHPSVGEPNQALIIPLYNPEAVVLNGTSAELGPPILLDLGGLGIRSMEYSAALGEYLIVAGSHKAGTEAPLQVLYRYNMTTEVLTKLDDFEIITPEGLFQFPDSSDIYLVSDDGLLLVETPEGYVTNKLLPIEQRTFRTQVVTP
ncbi:MAG: hypothetical protein ACYTFK_05990 [Planctomycetota bacterium]